MSSHCFGEDHLAKHRSSIKKRVGWGGGGGGIGVRRGLQKAERFNYLNSNPPPKMAEKQTFIGAF